MMYLTKLARFYFLFARLVQYAYNLLGLLQIYHFVHVNLYISQTRDESQETRIRRILLRHSIRTDGHRKTPDTAPINTKDTQVEGSVITLENSPNITSPYR